ncbi:MAG: hypothetical protein KGL39_17900 [Patescibacteria group bacterium]|nr:hypothetical protein [Patescibacteria group bacterium]
MKYCYSNNGLSWRTVEDDYAAQPGEALFSSIATDAQLTAAFSGYGTASSNASIYQQINALEALQTLRMIREAHLGSSNTFPSTDPNFPGMTSTAAITSIQTKINTLRGQLK